MCQSAEFVNADEDGKATKALMIPPRFNKASIPLM